MPGLTVLGWMVAADDGACGAGVIGLKVIGSAVMGLRVVGVEVGIGISVIDREGA